MSARTCPCPTCGTADLSALRAEVERLRDAWVQRPPTNGRTHPKAFGYSQGVQDALTDVLDLIDKQRENT